jgi:peptidoglycan/xylan/chitin deacetylase (PgdA/CDA1 family)
MSKLMIIWDYDTPIARITASKPYNYNFEACLDEERHVDYILEIAKVVGAKFTFAVVGFGAEASVAPFDVRDIIKEIAKNGHEIASHSWKHEWLPFLTNYQLDKTMERSKFIIENCIGGDYVVNGFVLPHDRPMSWYSKLAFSAGDRTIYPLFAGASIDGISRYLRKNRYKWIRVNYRSLWQKVIDWNGTNHRLKLNRSFSISNGLHYVPEHCMEFGSTTVEALQWAVKQNRPLVIAAHPGLFSFKKNAIDDFNKFMEFVATYRSKGMVDVVTVSEYLNLANE